jgi:predicted lipoprotein with Yx(FWY)xxD motif
MIRKTVLLLIAPIVLAACGTATVANTGAYHSAPGAAAASASASPTATPPPATTPTATPTAAPVAAPAPTHAPIPAPPRPAPVVFVADNMQLAAILVNGAGRTLYYFVPERGGRIVCTGSCTGVWPPLFSISTPASSVALAGQLSLVMRVGGDQVTYNHWPLYTFAGDTGPDQINGQGVFGFGGKWFVATPGLQP